MRRSWNGVWRIVLAIATTGLVGGAIVHLTVGDRFAALAPIAYAAPSPLLLVAALVLAAVHGYQRKRRLAVACCALAILAGWQWIGSWGAAPSASVPGPTCRILFWNAASPRHPSRTLIEVIRAEEPELVAVAEAGKWTDAAEADYRRELPDYHPRALPGQILVFSRQPIRVRETRRLPNRTAIHVLSCDTTIGPVRLVLADVGSDPLHDRKPQIREVLELANSEADTVVVGDFNTPYDSVAFDPFRERFTHALKDGGSGSIETWPSIAPCLAIDHVWLSPTFVPVSGRKRWTTKSDHAMIVADFARR
jgi:vancomycin resistance protein VanJ